MGEKNVFGKERIEKKIQKKMSTMKKYYITVIISLIDYFNKTFA